MAVTRETTVSLGVLALFLGILYTAWDTKAELRETLAALEPQVESIARDIRDLNERDRTRMTEVHDLDARYRTLEAEFRTHVTSQAGLATEVRDLMLRVRTLEANGGTDK